MESTIINISVRRFLLLILTILLVPLISSCADARVDPAWVRDTSRELMCTCGDCELVLSNCDCPRASELNALIEKKLSQGQPKEQIIQYFVEQYGEQVLAAPANP